MVHLSAVLPTHIVLLTIDTAAKLKRLCGKLGGVNCDDIELFQHHISENSFTMYYFKVGTFKQRILVIILKDTSYYWNTI